VAKGVSESLCEAAAALLQTGIGLDVDEEIALETAQRIAQAKHAVRDPELSGSVINPAFTPLGSD
jgi:hypothetical protein